MLTRILMLCAVVALFAAAGSALAADGEAVQARAAEPVAAEAVPEEAQMQPAGEALDEEWSAERREIDMLRSEAAGRIAGIEERLANEDLTSAEQASLHKEVGDIKLETEIRIQEIRLSVAEARGMTRHAEEIREALEALRNLEAPREAGVVERDETAPVPGEIIEPDQG